jgi:hypothetical protein
MWCGRSEIQAIERRGRLVRRSVQRCQGRHEALSHDLRLHAGHVIKRAYPGPGRQTQNGRCNAMNRPTPTSDFTPHEEHSTLTGGTNVAPPGSCASPAPGLAFAALTAVEPAVPASPLVRPAAARPPTGTSE